MNAPASSAARTVPELLRLQAARQPAAMALSAPSFHGHRDRLTYVQLVHRMEAMRDGLHSRGIGRGDRVAIFVTNDAAREGVLTALGSYALGAVAVPVNVRYGDEELAHALSLTEPAAILATAGDGERALRQYPSARILELGGDGDDGWPDPEHFRGEPAPGGELDGEDLTCLLFTSGTTSRSKAVMHCHRSQIATGRAMGGALGLLPGDIYQGGWPIFTSSVLNLACMAAWVRGASLVLEAASMGNAERLRLVESEATTVYHGVTAPLNFLMDEYEKGGFDLSRLRRIAYGGAVMPPEIIRRMRTNVPGADHVHVWGMTETGPAGTFLPPAFLERKMGWIGGAQPGCEIRIVDDAGAPVAAGQEGEIVFSGPSQSPGYFRNAEATAETFVDGWVRTGDVGRMDAEGHVEFLDRKKDIINRGGLKIASAAVESVILRHPDIADAAVVAIPHDRLGEDIAACVVARSGTADIAAVADFVADILADYQRPRHWLALEALPRNPMGKVLKRELRDIAARAAAEGRTTRPAA